MKTTTKSVVILFLAGIVMTFSIQLMGQTYPMPHLQNFNPPFPTGSVIGSDYLGWQSPVTNAVSLQNYVTNAWVSFDGSSVMNMRNREFVGGVRQTTFLVSPEIVVSGVDPVISWLETASTNAWTGPRDSPRNLYISVNSGDWIPVDSYSSGSMPNGYLGEGWRRMTYSLNDYSGQTIRWKWECISNNHAVEPVINFWEYTYWCIDNLFIGSGTEPTFRIQGTGDFGVVFIGTQIQQTLIVQNIGAGIIDLQSVSVSGSAAFSVVDVVPASPSQIYGIFGGAGVPSVTITIGFNPESSGPVNGNLELIHGGGIYPIPLSGSGLTCDDAISIPPPESSVNIVAMQNNLFSYTAAYDQTITVTSCHENNTTHPNTIYSYDTYLFVHSGCPLNADNLMGQLDDMEAACAYNRAASTVTVSLTANQTIYIWWPLLFPTAMHAFDPFVFTLSVTPPPPWPNAEFSASETLIEAGNSINYTSLSTGEPTSWEWDFTAGASPSTSNLQNPSGINYPAAGIYQVTHKATNAFYTGTLTKEFYIVVGEPASIPAMTESFSVSLLKMGGTVKGGGSWTFVDNTNSGMNWQVRNSGVSGCYTDEDPMGSTTGLGGYLVLPADEYNCLGGNPTATIVDAYAQSPSFDCSTFDAVVVEFQQRFKVCCNPPQMELMVSIDGGLNWKQYDLLNGRSMNATYGSPVETVKLNITEIAGRQPDVRIRFYWQGSSEYFWMIDDVEVKGIIACEGYQVSIAGKEKVYYGYVPMSSSVLAATVVGGLPPYQYLWSTGETTSSITVAPTITTEYFLDVVDVQGCLVKASFTVQVEDVRCGSNMDKVLMCKTGTGKKTPPQTICIEPSSVRDQLKTGATLGACKLPGFGGEGEIAEIEDLDLTVYPNPNSGRVNIDLKGMNEGLFIIEVRDVLGRTVSREEVSHSGGQYFKTIDLDRAGIYLISVKNSSVNLVKQVTVIR